MNGPASTVFLVDGHSEFRTALSHLLVATGYSVRLFESAKCFLDDVDAATPGCLLLDVDLPGLSGLELQRALIGSPCAHPIIFLSGTCDIHTSVQAMKAGAIDFLTNPIDAERLIPAIEQALRHDAKLRRERETGELIHQRLKKLTSRERQVMERVIRGQLNKQIAADLGTGEKTVKVHRGRMMAKMSVRSVPDLVRLGAHVGLVPWPREDFRQELKTAGSRAGQLNVSYLNGY
jgi:FixJ family two-component response regulator